MEKDIVIIGGGRGGSSPSALTDMKKDISLECLFSYAILKKNLNTEVPTSTDIPDSFYILLIFVDRFPIKNNSSFSNLYLIYNT